MNQKRNPWISGLEASPAGQPSEKKRRKIGTKTPEPELPALREEFPVFTDFPALRPAELEIFAILLRAKGKPVHRWKFRQLTGRSWESIQSHISHLRKGLQNHPDYPGLATGIHSIPHQYAFVLPERLTRLASRFQPRKRAS